MKRFLHTIFFISLSFLSFSQDPGFSQYYATPMYVNPAFAGDKQDLNFTINSRQYTNTTIANYNLTQFSGIIPIDASFLYNKSSKANHNSGIGVSVYREATGEGGQLNSMAGFLTLAHSIQLEREHFLGVGLQAGYNIMEQGDNFQWGSQYSEDFGYDPTIIPSVSGLANLKSTYPSFSAGIEYFYNSGVVEDYFKKHDFDAYVGFAAFNVNQPNQSFFDESESRLPLSYKINGGVKYHATNMLAFFPTVLAVYQNGNVQVNTGFYVNMRTVDTKKSNKKHVNILAGAWYRVGDSYIATLGFTVMDVKFAVSYDFNATNLSINNQGKGATEVSLKFSIPSSGRKAGRYSRGLLYPSF